MASKQVRMVNIPRSNTNQFYRYKMPELEAKVESRGNGIKTVIVNLSDIAKALARPTTCLFSMHPLSTFSDCTKQETSLTFLSFFPPRF